ncbi:MAG: hypothetical protein K2X32_10565 [Phycisphaerales bacterium]|nr:hypothetical protein [Phycisphaerales bacterium]
MNTTDPWYVFAHNDRWQKWGTFRAAIGTGSGSSWGGSGITPDANPKELFVHHRAGASGYGGSSYIDSYLRRDRSEEAWHAAGTASRVIRYYLQNWRADVIGTAGAGGFLTSHLRYSAYGVAIRINPVDIVDDANNPLGPTSGTNNGVTEADLNVFGSVFFQGSPANAICDIASDESGFIAPGGNDGVTESDYNMFYAKVFDGDFTNPSDLDTEFGTGSMGGNRIGYAGYEIDPVLIGSGSGVTSNDPTAYYHARHGTYDVQQAETISENDLASSPGPGYPSRPGPIVDRKPTRKSGANYLDKADLKNLCDVCCGPNSRSPGGCGARGCRIAMDEFFDNLERSWRRYHGRGPYDDGGGDSVGGYLCWDWSRIFMNALADVKMHGATSCLTGTINQYYRNQRGLPTSDHYMLEVTICKNTSNPKCTFWLDDGFLNGHIVHFKGPGDPWKKLPFPSWDEDERIPLRPFSDPSLPRLPKLPRWSPRE